MFEIVEDGKELWLVGSDGGAPHKVSVCSTYQHPYKEVKIAGRPQAARQKLTPNASSYSCAILFAA